MAKSLTSIADLHRSAMLFHETDEKEPGKSELYRITLELLKDINFYLVSVNIFLFCYGLSVVFTHIAPYIVSMSLAPTTSNTVLTSLGVANLAGRFGLGIVGA